MVVESHRGAGLTLLYAPGTVLGSALVENCTFTNNRADVNIANYDDIEQRPSLYIPRGNGGGLLMSFQNTSQYRVEIRNCSFIGNSARFTGGAISIQFFRGTNSSDSSEVQTSSRNNTIIIDGCVFKDNVCSRVGGAISINTLEAANFNEVTVSRSVFERNTAGLGGGAYSFSIEVSTDRTSGTRSYRNVCCCTP